MKSLNFVGQFYGDLGIPIHSREFAKALSKECNLTLMQIEEAPKDNVEKELKPFFKRLDFNNPCLTFWYPFLYDKYSISHELNLGYYIFEYTRIPKSFIEEINKLDGICTASKWGVNVLKENGIKVPCYVVHGGVSKRFNPIGKIKSNRLRFLHIGKMENRKGTEMLIRAFGKAFGGDRTVSLTLAIDNPHIKDFSPEQYLKELSKTSYVENNINIQHYIQDIKELYLRHDCAVFPTKAEGIGLPIIEAMGCGLAVIVSNKNGMSEYINKKNAIVIENTIKVPVYDSTFFPNAGEFGEWDSPTEDELIEKLKWVYSNYDETLRIGEQGSKWIHENYNWNQAANQLLEVI